ncbi:MAG: hypothetical protein ABIC95_07170 [archaeon]
MLTEIVDRLRPGQARISEGIYTLYAHLYEGIKSIDRVGDTLLQSPHLRELCPESLYQFYINNTGDLMDGAKYTLLFNYGIEKIADITAHITDELKGKNNLLYKISDSIRKSKTAVNAATFAFGASLIIVAETVGFDNTPDISDIPVGLAGVILYCGLRQLNIFLEQ